MLFRSLLFAKDFSLDWPTPYIFKNPVTLSQGTELLLDAYYTTSSVGPPPAGIRLTVSNFQGAPLPKQERAAVKTTQAAPQRYKLTGIVRSVDVKGSKLVVQHSAIPGYMPAMTMAYDAAKPEDIKKIADGDRIQADLVVLGTQMHLENIRILALSK